LVVLDELGFEDPSVAIKHPGDAMVRVWFLAHGSPLRGRSLKCDRVWLISKLIGLSGIDGSGKGFLAGHVVTALSTRRLKAVVIGADGWLNVPAVRFDAGRPGENFYENALRLDELFAQLVLPLPRCRSVCERFLPGEITSE
jgi:hypothetical protein